MQSTFKFEVWSEEHQYDIDVTDQEGGIENGGQCVDCVIIVNNDARRV